MRTLAVIGSLAIIIVFAAAVFLFGAIGQIGINVFSNAASPCSVMYHLRHPKGSTNLRIINILVAGKEECGVKYSGRQERAR